MELKEGRSVKNSNFSVLETQSESVSPTAYTIHECGG
jgi:hypothetical protein